MASKGSNSGIQTVHIMRSTLRSHPTGEHRSSRFVGTKLLLIFGFLGLIGALGVAINTPINGFEYSIYSSTPLLFWIGIAIGFVSAVAVAFRSDLPISLQYSALLLGGSSGLSIVGLPIIRGYYFTGKGDSLSHLGFARSFASGTMSPLDLLHPGVQLTSVIVNVGTGSELHWSMHFTVFVFFVLFFVFIPLCAKRLAGTRSALTTGLFVAILLVPINGIATHVVTHPSSQAILFTPFILFLLLVYLAQPTQNHLKFSGMGILLALASITILFIHPQETMLILVIFSTIAIVQFIIGRIKPVHELATQRSLYFQSLFLWLLWLLWTPRSPRVYVRINTAYQYLFGGSSAASGTEIASRSSSLTVIGASLEELFFKLFLVGFIISIIAGIVMLLSILGRLDDSYPDKNVLNKYLTIAFAPLIIGTGFVFIANYGDHYFRFIGFIMVIVSIVASAGLAKRALFPRRINVTSARLFTVILLLMLLPLAVMSLHPSPWIYQDNAQVTEQTLEGYHTAFEQNPGDIEYAGIRTSGSRYVDALYGPNSAMAASYSGDVIPPDVFAADPRDSFSDERYIPVTSADIEREVRLYRGFRYELTGFQRLETTPGINRVQSTDEFQLYHLPDE